MLRKRLQLSLIHMAVAMTAVPIDSTLNRVMINELAIPATLTALLVSLPYLFSPIQVAIGSLADKLPLFGLRRSPYILIGLILCVAGVTLAPWAAFELANGTWSGYLAAALAFGLWGMGFNFATVSYFALASEISGDRSKSRTISIMFFVMILAVIVTAITLSRLVEPYSPENLTRGVWLVAAASLLFGLLGLIGLEQRGAFAGQTGGAVRIGEMVQALTENRQATLFFWYLILLLAAVLGQDVLLEPFAGQAFGMSVTETTRITSLWGVMVLISLLATVWLERRFERLHVAKAGSIAAVAAFGVIGLSGLMESSLVFYLGVIMLGLSTGVATVSNLALMLDMTVAGRVGLFMGAWGMANAFSRLAGALIAGSVRDVVSQQTANPVLGYVVVFGLDALMLVVSLALLSRIDVRIFQRSGASSPAVMERMALAGEA